MEKCVTSLRRNNMKNPEENTRSQEGEHTQKEDTDSSEGGNPDWRGTTGAATSRNKEEASLNHLRERAERADGSGRRPAEDALTCHVPGLTRYMPV
ncbi:hypothetical protein NDU88_001635 [Pleurodeles waltl]|uniref:Uncharacterized protein n=1 Tax=Pleurodeles waltl TaxID=8319 RepID=A0AAV7R949_PLEWA|nr:hypothetical protein NDU88_001635 [Pleurodeles waltl]